MRFLTIFTLICLTAQTSAFSQTTDVMSEPLPFEQSQAKDQDFTGYYVLDGKMFFYDQKTGAINPVNETGRPETALSAGEAQTPTKSSILEETPVEELREYSERPVQVANIARDAQSQGSDEFACNEWGSTFLKSKTFSSKEECDSNLEIALDQALVDVDKYIDSFEKHKRALQLSAEYEDYKKLSDFKLDFTKAKQILTMSYRKGCTCLSGAE